MIAQRGILGTSTGFTVMPRLPMWCPVDPEDVKLIYKTSRGFVGCLVNLQDISLIQKDVLFICNGRLMDLLRLMLCVRFPHH